jgi:hypothetical protein
MCNASLLLKESVQSNFEKREERYTLEAPALKINTRNIAPSACGTSQNPLKKPPANRLPRLSKFKSIGKRFGFGRGSKFEDFSENVCLWLVLFGYENEAAALL